MKNDTTRPKNGKKIVRLMVLCSYLLQSSSLYAVKVPSSYEEGVSTIPLRQFTEFKSEKYSINLDELKKTTDNKTITWFDSTSKKEVLTAEVTTNGSNKSVSIRSTSDTPITLFMSKTDSYKYFDKFDLYGGILTLAFPLKTHSLSFSGESLELINSCHARSFMCRGGGDLIFSGYGNVFFNFAHIDMESLYSEKPLKSHSFIGTFKNRLIFEKNTHIGSAQFKARKVMIVGETTFLDGAHIEAKMFKTGEKGILNAQNDFILSNARKVSLKGKNSFDTLLAKTDLFNSINNLTVRKYAYIDATHSTLKGEVSSNIFKLNSSGYVYFDDSLVIQNAHHFSVFSGQNLAAFAKKITALKQEKFTNFPLLSEDEKKSAPAGVFLHSDGFSTIDGKIKDLTILSLFAEKDLKMGLRAKAPIFMAKTHQGSIDANLALSDNNSFILSSGKNLTLTGTIETSKGQIHAEESFNNKSFLKAIDDLFINVKDLQNKGDIGGKNVIIDAKNLKNYKSIEAEQTLKLKVKNILSNMPGGKLRGKNIFLDAGLIFNLFGILHAKQHLDKKSYVDLNLGVGIAKTINRISLLDLNFGPNFARDIAAQSIVSVRLFPDVGLNVSNKSVISLGGISAIALNNSDTSVFQAGFGSLGLLSNNTTALFSYNFFHGGLLSSITALKGAVSNNLSLFSSFNVSDFILGNTISPLGCDVLEIGPKDILKQVAKMAGGMVLNDLVLPKAYELISDTVGSIKKTIEDEKKLEVSKNPSLWSKTLDFANFIYPKIEYGVNTFVCPLLPIAAPLWEKFSKSPLMLNYLPATFFEESDSKAMANLQAVFAHRHFITNPIESLFNLGIDKSIDFGFSHIPSFDVSSLTNGFYTPGRYVETGTHYGNSEVSFSNITLNSQQKGNFDRNYNGINTFLSKEASSEGVSTLNTQNITVTGREYLEVLNNTVQGFNLNPSSSLDIHTDQHITLTENITNPYAVNLHSKTLSVDASQTASHSRGFEATEGDVVYNAPVTLEQGSNAVLSTKASGKLINTGVRVQAPYQHIDVKGDADILNGGLFKAYEYLYGKIDGKVTVEAAYNLTFDGPNFAPDAPRADYYEHNTTQGPKHKNYVVGGFEAESGIKYMDAFGNERTVSIELIVGEMKNHASAITGNEDIIVVVKKGLEATADYDSYVYEVHSAKKPGGEIKWHTYTGGYNLQRPEFSSKNGKVIIYVEEGNARLQAAKVSSKDGIEIIIPNGVLEKESVITSNNWYEHYKHNVLLDTHGTQKGEISHGVILSTEKSGEDLKKYVIEKTDEHTQETVSSFDLDSVKKDKIPYIQLQAQEIIGTNSKIQTPILVTQSDGNIIYETDILNHHFVSQKKSKAPSVYEIPLDKTGIHGLMQKLDLLKVKNLSEKQNLDQVIDTFNGLNQLLNCSDMADLKELFLKNPTIGFEKTKKTIDYHYQTTGDGFIEADYWIVEAGNQTHLGLPTLIYDKLFLKTNTFSQEGTCLKESLYIENKKKKLSIGFGGISASKSKQTLTKESTLVQNQPLVVLGTIVFDDVKEWTMTGANTYCKNIEGHVGTLNITSLQSTTSSTVKSKSVSLAGSFSSQKSTSSQTQTIDSGVYVDNDSKALENFSVDQLSSNAGSFVCKNSTDFTPKEVIASSSKDTFSSSSKKQGVNILKAAQILTSPSTAFLNATGLMDVAGSYSKSTQHQEFEHQSTLCNIGLPNDTDVNQINTGLVKDAKKLIDSKSSKTNFKLVQINPDNIKDFTHNLGKVASKVQEKLLEKQDVSSNSQFQGQDLTLASKSAVVDPNTKNKEDLITHPIIPVIVTDPEPLEQKKIDKETVDTSIRNPFLDPTFDEDVEDAQTRFYLKDNPPTICSTLVDAYENPILKPASRVLEYKTPFLSTLRLMCDDKASKSDVIKEATETILDFSFFKSPYKKGVVYLTLEKNVYEKLLENKTDEEKKEFLEEKIAELLEEIPGLKFNFPNFPDAPATGGLCSVGYEFLRNL